MTGMLTLQNIGIFPNHQVFNWIKSALESKSNQEFCADIWPQPQ